MEKKHTCVIVGAGHRAEVYAAACPDRVQVVGVADPCPLRRQHAAARFGLELSQCFGSADDLAMPGKEGLPGIFRKVLFGLWNHSYAKRIFRGGLFS